MLLKRNYLFNYKLLKNYFIFKLFIKICNTFLLILHYRDKLNKRVIIFKLLILQFKNYHDPFFVFNNKLILYIYIFFVFFRGQRRDVSATLESPSTASVSFISNNIFLNIALTKFNE